MKVRTSSRNAASSRERLSSIVRAPLPLLAKWADLELERPGAARLMIELPVGFRDRRRRHQQVWIIERAWTESFEAPLAHPLGIDAGVDDEMRDVNVLRPQLARRSLGDGPQTELGTGEGCITDSAAQARRRAGEEDV